jgi:hypothetical protein
MHSVTGATSIRAEISSLGTVEVTFGAAPDSDHNETKAQS